MKFAFYNSILILIINLVSVSSTFPQKATKQYPVKRVIQMNKQNNQIMNDNLVEQELSPLNISKSKGLYIMPNDGLMQLRILGSVRFSALYDFVELPMKNTFNTFYIPTGAANKKVPNYYNSLSYTRMGFEITRKTKQGDVFTRIESDFNGTNSNFRIRHAYGQVGRFLLGQTWSLLTNVTDLPITVDPNGPTGTVMLRTPKIQVLSFPYLQEIMIIIAVPYRKIINFYFTITFSYLIDCLL